ncbi:hypothetical protein [Nitrosospira sp. Nsp13]|jgi:hypothetical protein|uniref:hypothetical protein n=1 Tax=Nitrosospira sp. Nsp13 TaxID=1855332 RepID=UPI00088C9306|nr:hypothetical protein [Nitrosospira sp. Nsp13]SCX82603.1 hypothetical protein SAMN05216308_101440 [Nitrosospira sp. Nsp13]
MPLVRYIGTVRKVDSIPGSLMSWEPGQTRNMTLGDAERLLAYPDSWVEAASDVWLTTDSFGDIGGLVGNAGDTYPIISRSIEVLSSTAVAAPCTSAGINEVLASFPIPAGTLGVNSILQIEPLWTFTSSANNKFLRIAIGGTVLFNVTRTTAMAEAPLWVMINRNSLNSQILPYSANSGYFSAGAGFPAVATIDFSVTNTVELIGQRASSGDSLVLEYYRALHFLGD